MTVKDVTDTVRAIESMAETDWECAHSLEDQLHRKILHAIANGAENPQELAKAALKTKNIQFTRHCA